MDTVRRPDDEAFWTLVALADSDFDAFCARLEAMDGPGLTGFAWAFEEKAGVLWDVRYHHDRFSEDDLEDLCGWVVGRGRAFYEDIVAHPERMPTEWNPAETGMDIQYQATQTYFERFGSEMPAFESP